MEKGSEQFAGGLGIGILEAPISSSVISASLLKRSFNQLFGARLRHGEKSAGAALGELWSGFIDKPRAKHNTRNRAFARKKKLRANNNAAGSSFAKAQ